MRTKEEVEHVLETYKEWLAKDKLKLEDEMKVWREAGAIIHDIEFVRVQSGIIYELEKKIFGLEKSIKQCEWFLTSKNNMLS